MPDHLHRLPEFRGDGRAQTISARQAAEALFKPKPAVSEPSVFDSAESAKARIPRVLPALPPTCLRPRSSPIAAFLAVEIGVEVLPRVRV